MDKIYSRKRITFFYSDDNKQKKKVKIILILIIAIITAFAIFQSVDPIFEELCKGKAIAIGTTIINEEKLKILDNYEYNNIVSITKNEGNNTNVLKTDVAVINEIASEIAFQISKRLETNKGNNICIPVGAITGSKFLSGIGPKIKLKIIPEGNVLTKLKTEFKDEGINQTVYRIYLEITCKVSILTSYKVIEEEISNQVLLVETVIVGEVPTTYYNLDGIGEDNVLDIIE